MGADNTYGESNFNPSKHNCSECSKSLSDNNGNVVIYKPQSNGITQTHIKGFQCSLECYTNAMSKK